MPSLARMGERTYIVGDRGVLLSTRVAGRLLLVMMLGAIGVAAWAGVWWLVAYCAIDVVALYFICRRHGFGLVRHWHVPRN